MAAPGPAEVAVASARVAYQRYLAKFAGEGWDRQAALGASRVDLIKQMLVENFALAIPGGALGALLALWGADLLRTLTKVNLPRLDELSASPSMLAFAATYSIS